MTLPASFDPHHIASPLRRRDLLLGAGALAFMAVAPRGAAAAAPGPADAEARQLLDRIAEELLAHYPENAASLGLDRDRRAGLKAKLTDRSPQGHADHAAAAARRLASLRSIDRSRVSPAVALDLDVAEAAHALADEGYRGFPYGDVALLNQYWNYRNAPYAVSQNTGAYVEIPDLLDSLHLVDDGADAEAYILRLSALAAAIDGESARVRADASRGVIAPSFLLDTAIGQMRAMVAPQPADWGLVRSFAAKTAGAKLPDAEAWNRRAETAIAKEVAPALARQLELMQELRGRADERAGAWKLPDGEAYYAWALRAGTTSSLTPDEVHALGLEQVRSLNSEMDALLRQQGLTSGSVGARMEALGKDPRHLYPNTDEGRAQILAYLNAVVDDIRTRLPRAFNTLVKGNLVIKRVPPEIEAGAPNGYAGAGSIDGTIPGMYYINLRDTGMWPKFSLPTLTYHEGIPGHVWQGEYTYKLPLARSLLSFNAYSEGWALYAEQLADELGVYETDPLGRLGYLQSMSFRACRLVVDTGIHSKRWTREQAIQWFVETNGSTPEEVRGEIDRYCAWPGQACGYKVGHSEIARLRDKARTALGARFDLRSFNDAVLLGGGVPLTLLERVIDDHVAATARRAA